MAEPGGWLRDFVEPSGPTVANLERLAGPGASSLARQLYPPSVVTEIARLWMERERFLAALDWLPQTFCHLDAFQRNLLIRAGPEGEQVVAIDWAYAGRGAVGEELGQLAVASLFFFATEGIAPTRPRRGLLCWLRGGVAGGGLGRGRTPRASGLHCRHGAAPHGWSPPV